jgi:hypothetical protein
VFDIENGIDVLTIIQWSGRRACDNSDHGNRGTRRDRSWIEKVFSHSQETTFGAGSVCCRGSSSFSRKLENLYFCAFFCPFGLNDHSSDHDDPTDIITGS